MTTEPAVKWFQPLHTRANVVISDHGYALHICLHSMVYLLRCLHSVQGATLIGGLLNKYFST
jgi:hypothetical protein